MVKIIGVTDQNFLIPYTLCFHSILKHTKNFVELFLIHKNIDDNSLKYIEECLKKQKHSNYSLTFIKLPKPYEELIFSKFKKVTTHCTNSTFMKIAIPELFKDDDKVLYVDGDFAFYDDIIELYRIDLENKLVGAIGYSWEHQSVLKKAPDLCEETGLTEWFNAGLMLFNLKKMREINFLDKYVQWYENHRAIAWGDQICFNGVCNNDWKRLPKEWNVPYLHRYCEIWKTLGDAEEFNSGKGFHFIATDKPWKDDFYKTKTDKVILEYNEIYKQLFDKEIIYNPEVNVYFIVDSIYIYPTKIALYSLLKNTSRFIHVYISFYNCSEEEKKAFYTSFKSFSNCSFHTVDIPQEVLDKLEIYSLHCSPHITITTWIRLYIDIIFKNINIHYLLYLDGDILVLRDVGDFPLYNKEGIVAIKSANCDREMLLKMYNIIDDYFNAGIVCYNLDKYKQEKYSEACERWYIKNKRRIIYNDQDVLNNIFNDKKLLLEKEWNFSHQDRALENIDIDYIFNSIIHYTGKYKPWNEDYLQVKTTCFIKQQILLKIYKNWERQALEFFRDKNEP